MKLRGQVITKEDYEAIRTEVIAEYGEIDEAAVAARNAHSAQFLPLFLIPILAVSLALPVIVGVAGAGLVAGGIAGGVVGGISAHKKHRKKKEKKKEKEGKKTKGLVDRAPEGATVWNTGADATPIVSMTELAATPTTFVI